MRITDYVRLCVPTISLCWIKKWSALNWQQIILANSGFPEKDYIGCFGYPFLKISGKRAIFNKRKVLPATLVRIILATSGYHTNWKWQQIQMTINKTNKTNQFGIILLFIRNRFIVYGCVWNAFSFWSVVFQFDVCLCS